jgi:hypothetical protein
VFKAFFAAGLRLLAHRFVVEVLWRFEVQIHQLTLNVMAALRSMCGSCPHMVENRLLRSSQKIIVCTGIKGR